MSLFAYFDPGAGSLLMQALVGGGAGLVVFGKYLWNATFARPGRSNQRPVAGSEGRYRASASSGEIPISAAL